MPKPVLVLVQTTYLCGKTFAVDGTQTSWSEGGCENGEIVLSQRGKLSDDAFADLMAAFGAFPEPSVPSEPCAPASSTFTRITETATREWEVCTEEYSPSEFEEPFSTAVAIFQQIR